MSALDPRHPPAGATSFEMSPEERRAYETTVLLPLQRLRGRWRMYAALAGLVRVWLLVVLTSLLQLVLDRWLRLTTDQRAALNAALSGVWAWWTWRRIVRPAVSPLDEGQLSQLIDRAHPDLQDLLTAAVQFAAGRVGDPRSNSPLLLRHAIRDACERAARLDFLSVLNHRRAVQRGIEFFGVTLVVLLAFIIEPGLMGTWFKRNWLLLDVPWPQRTYLVPDGFVDRAGSAGQRRVPRGDELNLVVRVEGDVPPSAQILWRSASGQRGKEEMNRVAGTRFEINLGAISEDISFHLVGGDDVTREYRIAAVDRPHITRTLARITPPTYTGDAPADFERQSVLDVPRGGQVTIDAWVNKPLAGAQFITPEGQPIACELLDDAAASGKGAGAPDADHRRRRVRVTVRNPDAGTSHFDLTDGDGLKDRNPIRFTVRILPDKPPSVKMALRGVGELVTPDAEVAAELQFSDGYGLSAAEYFAQKNSEAILAQEIGWPIAASGPSSTPAAVRREFAASPRLEFARLGVQPGERVRLSARATDNDPAGPNQTSSATVELRVVTREDFQTEMSRREFALRQEFERQITAQKLLNDALDRALTEMPAAGSPDNRLVQRLAGISRQQEQIGRRCLVIRDQFEALLAEMWTSKVAGAAVERRITEGIATPLGEIARVRMQDAVAAIQGARQGAPDEKRQLLRVRQAEILRYMQTVLASMLRWEGYQEAVTMLREIIGEQSDVRSKTMEAINRQLDEILGEVEAGGGTASKPAGRP